MGDVLDEITACVPALRRYAHALTHDRAGADDLVQDCLERAIRKRSLWRPIGPIKPWLFRILLNLHRNEVRHVRRRPVAVRVDELADTLGTSGSQVDRAALAETARAMGRLPADQREALLLIAVEGFSYAQAAAILDIPVGTLMSRLGRARAALRDMTSENGPSVLKAIK